MTSNVPIFGPNEIIDLRLRLPVVPTWISVWRDGLEADPVAIPLNGLYAALRDGVADASEGDLSQISSFRLYEVQDYLSITDHLVGVGWVMVNKSFYAGLSSSNRERILGAMKKASEWGTQTMINDEDALLDFLEAQGMTIVTADAEAIRTKARPAVDALFQSQWPVTTWAEVLAQ
jgi:TRAP-type C4-dicarboxylate transport system substrate-binding protein